MPSYWLDPLPPPRPALEGALTVDVLVVGAGLCGTSAALALARGGARVALLEARQVSMSASGRNAGFILQGTAERYSRAVGLLGRARARRIHTWSLENHRMLAETIRETGLDCSYQRRGSLQLAGSVEEEHDLLESAALLVEDGFKADLVAPAELPPALQRAGFRVGVHLPEDGEVDPAALVRGLADCAEESGATVHEQTPVLTLTADADGWSATTPRGEVRASVAVLATNARAGELVPWLRDKVDPVRGQMLACGPVAPLFPCPVYANHGYDYWRQDPRGVVVLGGWRNLDPDGEVGHDEVLHAGIQERMTSFLATVGVPPEAPVLHRWSGIMGFSRDGLPLVGSVPGSPTLLVGVGFTGHGFGFAHLAGRALATLALEGRHAVVDDFGPGRLG